MAHIELYKDGNILYPRTKKEYIIGLSDLSNARSVNRFACYFGAHRGYSDIAPENTMPAFVAAAKAGYSLIEVDVVQSSDGVQFLCHDATINRTSDGTGTIAQMTAAQLLTYDFGYPAKFGTKYAGTKIPTLEEFLLFCKKMNLYAELDIADDSRYNNTMLQTTYDIVRRCNMLDATFFCARTGRLDALYNIDNTVMISISGMTSETAINNASYLLATSRQGNFSIPNANATEALIQAAHNAGGAVKTWYSSTASDTEARARQVFNLGAECVLSEMFAPNDFDWLQ